MTPSDKWQAFFARLCRIEALAILAVVALAYPLKVDSEALSAVSDPMLVNWLGPLLTFGVAPLVLKETLFGILVLLLFVTFVIWQAFWPRRDREARWRLIGAVVLAVLAFASVLWWSPTFYYSLKTLTRVASGLAFYCVVASLASDRKGLLESGGWVIVIVSGLVALVAMMQHFGVSAGFLPLFDEPRNRVGSFIGQNTGMSNYLLGAFFLSVSMLFSRRSPASRTFLACLLAVHIFVIIVAQSRAVWLLAALLTPAQVFVLRRATGVGPRLRHWAVIGAVGVGILATQLIESPLNILSVRGYPLLERMKDFRPDQLRRETRTRIVVCSGRLVFANPASALIGHGLGSFQYVYPKAQMDYYTSHDDLWIEPTDKITTRAHNDYLQLVIECGLLGLLLVGAWFAVDVRRGWRRQCEAMATDARGESLRVGALFALVATLLHALVDFPFHVTPLVATFLFLLATWSATRAPGEDDATVDATRATRDSAYMSIIGTLLFCGFALFCFRRELVVDVCRAQGETAYNLLDGRYRDADAADQFAALNYSLERYWQANRLEPLRADLHFNRALVLLSRAELFSRSADEYHRVGDDKNDRAQGQRAVIDLESAVQHIDEALAEHRNHVVYMALGRALRRLYELTGDREFLSLATDNLELSTRYSPSYAEAAVELISLYVRERQQPKRILELRRQLDRYAPHAYNVHFERSAYDLLYNGYAAQAIPQFRALVAVADADVSASDNDATRARADAFRRHMIEAMIDAGQREQAEAELREAETRYPNEWFWAKARARLLAVDGGWNELAKLARGIIDNNPDPGDNDFWETAEAMATWKAGLPGGEAMMAVIQTNARDNQIYRLYLGTLAIDWFGDSETAIRELTIRSRLKPEADAYVHGRLALLLFDAKRYDEAREQVNTALTKKPDYLRMRALDEQLRAIGK